MIPSSIYGLGSHPEILDLESSSFPPVVPYPTITTALSSPQLLSTSTHQAWEFSPNVSLHNMAQPVLQDSSSAPLRRRAAIACTRCRKRKIACNNGDQRSGPHCKSCQVANINPDLCQYHRVGTDAPQEIPHSAFELANRHLRQNNHYQAHQAPTQFQHRFHTHPQMSRPTPDGYHESNFGGNVSHRLPQSMAPFPPIPSSSSQNQFFIPPSMPLPPTSGSQHGISFGMSGISGDSSNIPPGMNPGISGPSNHISAQAWSDAHLPTQQLPAEGWTESSPIIINSYNSQYSPQYAPQYASQYSVPTVDQAIEGPPFHGDCSRTSKSEREYTPTSSYGSSQTGSLNRQSIGRVLSAEVYHKPRPKMASSDGQIPCDPDILPLSEGHISRTGSNTNQISFLPSLNITMEISRPVSVCTSASTDSLLICKDVDVNPLGYVTSGLSNLSVPQEDSSPASDSGSGGYGVAKTPTRCLSRSDEKWVDIHGHESYVSSQGSNHTNYRDHSISSVHTKFIHPSNLGGYPHHHHAVAPEISPEHRYGYGCYTLPRNVPILGPRGEGAGENLQAFGYGGYEPQFQDFK